MNYNKLMWIYRDLASSLIGGENNMNYNKLMWIYRDLTSSLIGGVTNELIS